MKLVTYFLCDNCGELFEKKDGCSTHENTCLPLEIGQEVSFPLDLSIQRGHIYELHPAVLFGKNVSRPFVCIKTEEALEGYIDWSQLHDGMHFVAPWNDIRPVDTSQQKSAA